MLLTNDASPLCIAINGVNAANCDQLETQFWQQLDHLWTQANLPAKDFQRYRQVAGPWEINRTIDRSQTGRLTDVSRMLDGPDFSDPKLSDQLSRIIRDITAGTSQSWADLPTIFAADKLNWQAAPVTVTPKIDDTQLKQIVAIIQKDGAQFKQEGLTGEQFDHLIDQLGAVNTQLIKVFVDQLRGQFLAKTVKAYDQELTFYLNEYLAYHGVTLLDEEAGQINELLHHGSSVAQVKRARTGLRRLYRFLEQHGVVTAKQLAPMREALREDPDEVAWISREAMNWLDL